MKATTHFSLVMQNYRHCVQKRRLKYDTLSSVPAYGTRNTCNRVGRLDLGGEKLGLFEENSDYLMETWGAKILFA